MFRKDVTFGQFSEQAQVALELARLEAHQLQHEYIGTEHILLSLMKEPSGLAASVLKTFHVDAAMVQAEIEKLIQRGPKKVVLPQLPCTPRAKQALAYAVEEARFWNQKSIGPEHLLLGLLREAEGVAGQTLKNLGLVFDDVVREVVKARLAQMKAVERAVRPVRTTIAHKRKMREELLAHLTAIYDEEFARSKNSTIAIQEAQRRFGNPAELAEELDAAVPRNERIGYHCERWFGWRPPETVNRYLMRQARLTFFIIAAIGCFPVVAALWNHWSRSEWQTLQPLAAALLLTPAAQFAIGMLYFKMRDSLLGAFGKPKSRFKALVFDADIALAVVAIGFGYFAFANGDFTTAVSLLAPLCGAAFAVAGAYLLLARFRGPTEIRDTLWACLNLNDAHSAATPGSTGSGNSFEPA
ncbi:MAG TPA: Clp protease N-terminal domain-containing protein [Pirellulales bacterium]|jgi:ATP-dependent Clp protease ATP-binding subunit ClpC|nr:Clp protease N-terminal domain-containing protein [Pirellulales bacterium]